jgi:hypothetical protein
MCFTWAGDKNCPIPLSVVCGKQLTNAAMVPQTLKRHFNYKSQPLTSKDASYFK